MDEDRIRQAWRRVVECRGCGRVAHQSVCVTCRGGLEGLDWYGADANDTDTNLRECA